MDKFEGQLPTDRIEQGFALTALASFFALIGAMTWLMVVG